MKKAGKALSGLLAAAVLAAAAAVIVLPIYRQQKQQDETLLGQTEQSTFAETEQSLKMRESPLAMSLYRNKQHILLAGESGGQTSSPRNPFFIFSTTLLAMYRPPIHFYVYCAFMPFMLPHKKYISVTVSAVPDAPAACRRPAAAWRSPAGPEAPPLPERLHPAAPSC